MRELLTGHRSTSLCQHTVGDLLSSVGITIPISTNGLPAGVLNLGLLVFAARFSSRMYGSKRTAALTTGAMGVLGGTLFAAGVERCENC